MQSLTTLFDRSTFPKGENGGTRGQGRGVGGLVLIFSILVLAGLWQGGYGGRVGRYVTQIAGPYLSSAGIILKEVRVRGQRDLPDRLLFQALGISAGQSLLGFDAQSAQKRLVALGWVEKARIMRLWPSTLLVEIKERHPMARWQHEGRVELIDRWGVVLSSISPKQETSFPLVSGKGANQGAARLIRLLSIHSPLSQLIARAERIGSYRWNLYARSGAVIKLPPRDLALSLARFVGLTNWRKLLAQPGTVIDLRSREHIFVKSAKRHFRHGLSRRQKG